MKKILLYVPSLALAAFGVMAFVEPAFAQQRIDFEGLQLFLFGGNEGNDLFRALQGILNFVLLIGGLLAFFFVLFGGFVYLTAGGDTAKADNGRKIIVNAVIGIIVIFLSFAIVRFVISRTEEPQTDSVTDFT